MGARAEALEEEGGGEGVSMKPNEQTPPQIPGFDDIEQCLSPDQIGSKLAMSTDKVRRLFVDEPGVLHIGHPTLQKGRGYKRRYFMLRIPISVFLRVQDRLKAPRPKQTPLPAQRPARNARPAKRARRSAR